MTDDSNDPSVAMDSTPEPSPRLRKLKDLHGWRAVRLVVAIFLVAGAVSTGLAALTGWTDSRAGAAIAFVFAATAALFGFAQGELADRTVREGAVVATGVIVLIVGLVGLLWMVRPRPNPLILNGDLNIAVLPLAIDPASTDSDGGEFTTQYADSVTVALRRSTETTLDATGLQADIQVIEKPPDLTASEAELAERGAALAESSRADFVLTGELSFPEGRTVIRPLLYVSEQGVPDAPELSGWYAGSDPLVATVDLRRNDGARRTHL